MHRIMPCLYSAVYLYTTGDSIGQWLTGTADIPLYMWLSSGRFFTCQELCGSPGKLFQREATGTAEECKPVTFIKTTFFLSSMLQDVRFFCVKTGLTCAETKPRIQMMATCDAMCIHKYTLCRHRQLGQGNSFSRRSRVVRDTSLTQSIHAVLVQKPALITQ